MKFSIRDLMLVTIIVVVCTAWCLDRIDLRREIVRLKKLAETPNYGVYLRITGRIDALPIGDY